MRDGWWDEEGRKGEREIVNKKDWVVGCVCLCESDHEGKRVRMWKKIEYVCERDYDIDREIKRGRQRRDGKREREDI